MLSVEFLNFASTTDSLGRDVYLDYSQMKRWRSKTARSRSTCNCKSP